MRPPARSVATALTWCSDTDAPASHSHSQGGMVTTQICRPFTKKATADAASIGSTRARSSVGPLTYASAPGDRIVSCTPLSGFCADARTPIAITSTALHHKERKERKGRRERKGPRESTSVSAVLASFDLVIALAIDG